MNTIEHLLTVLAEECGEVAKECHKALRFGLDDQVTLDPLGPRGTTGPTNREKIIHELNDVMAMVHLLQAHGVLPPRVNDDARIERKKERVYQYMAYAIKVGALQPE